MSKIRDEEEIVVEMSTQDDDSAPATTRRRVEEHDQDFGKPTVETVLQVNGGLDTEHEGDAVDAEACLEDEFNEEQSVAIPEAKKLFVRVNFFDLPEIDTKSQSFVLRFYLEVCWEAKLSADQNRIAEEDRNFDPKIVFKNICGEAMSRDDFDTEELNYHNSNLPMMCKRCRVTAKFSSQVLLKYFPFDVQDFVLQVRTDLQDYQAVLCENTILLSSANADAFTTSNEYTFGSKMYTLTRIDQGARSKFSEIHFRLVGYRQPGFVINNIFVPIIIISVLGLTVFTYRTSERNEDFEKRFALNGSLLLTLVAYKFSTSSNIPAVNYLTFADKYVLFSIFFQVALVLWSAIVINFIPLDTQNSADEVMCVVFALVWFIWFIFLVALIAVKKSNIAMRRQHRIKGDAQAFDWLLFNLSDFVDMFVPSKSEIDQQKDANWTTRDMGTKKENDEPRAGDERVKGKPTSRLARFKSRTSQIGSSIASSFVGRARRTSSDR